MVSALPMPKINISILSIRFKDFNIFIFIMYSKLFFLAHLVQIVAYIVPPSLQRLQLWSSLGSLHFYLNHPLQVKDNISLICLEQILSATAAIVLPPVIPTISPLLMMFLIILEVIFPISLRTIPLSLEFPEVCLLFLYSKVSST